MVSRGSSRGRAFREGEDLEERGRLPRSSRRASIESSSTKIPSSFWFSRSKERNKDVVPRDTRTIASGQKHSKDTSTDRGQSKSASKSSTSRGLGLGLSALKHSTHSSKSDVDHRERRVLRRKTTTRDAESEYQGTESMESSVYEPRIARRNHEAQQVNTRLGQASAHHHRPPLTSESAASLPASRVVHPEATSSSRMESYNNVKSFPADSPQFIPPTMSYSSGSSTRRSESPSAFSRTSTPTSLSSVSPAMPLPNKTPSKTRQQSPTRSRPPVTRHKYGDTRPQTQGLAPVKESGTSSSSSSTIKGPERNDPTRGRQLSPPPPSPPVPATAADAISSLHSPIELRSLPHRRISLEEPRRSSETSRSRSGVPPARPSREGTPRLDEYLAPSPVIRSNLSRLTSPGHKRRESLDRVKAGTESMREGQRSNPAKPALSRAPSNSAYSSKPSRLPSPSGTGAPSHNLDDTRRNDVLISTTVTSTTRPKKESTPTSASSTNSTSRFGLFSRKIRSPIDEKDSTDPLEKPQKKGPAAGTGHEGYGKYARRGRSTSANTSTSRGRSTSTTGTANSGYRTPISRKSSVSEPEMDDFLLQRLAPVVISGGAVADSRISHDSYRTSMDSMTSLTSTAAGSTYSSQGMQPPMVTTTVSRGSHKLRRESRNLPADHHYIRDPSTGERRPTLATRRSIHRSQILKEADPLKVPDPINVKASAPSALSSRDTLPTSALPSEVYSEGREGNWLKSNKKSKKNDPAPKKKNFFQRVLASPKKPQASSQSIYQEATRELPATITRIPQSRSVPYYAMMDTQSQNDLETTGYPSYDTETAYPEQTIDGSSSTADVGSSSHIDNRKHSMLLPSPPTHMTGFSSTSSLGSARAVMYQPDSIPIGRAPSPPSKKLPQTGTSRLQQVGRIPRVSSKRDRLHNPPPQSFSRPFANLGSSRKTSFSEVSESESMAPTAPPVLGIQTERLQSEPWVEESSANPMSAPVVLGFDPSPVQHGDFLTFPARQYSQTSGSSSSGVIGITAHPATQPVASAMGQDDEVWNEYNALIDHVEKSSTPSPERKVSQAKSSGGSKGKQKATIPAPLSIRKDDTSRSKRHSASRSHAAPVHPPPEYDLPAPPSLSQLLTPKPSGEASLTPLSITSFLAGYADRNRNSQLSKRYSDTSGSHYSIDDVPLDIDPALAKRNTQIMVEKTSKVPGPQSNLRLKALMTSRWLSFGRVLFSPAHHEVQSNKQDRVLVLDGLANDDWSFYCALSYPNATFYNLSPFRRSSASRRDAETFPSPPNHRQIFHSGISHPFPFPKGFFTAVVFRYPVASPEAAYTAAIRECKRVLRPGGYLELSILDIDMVNMGNRTRRAVRSLKIRMQQADPEVSLSPLSDSFQRMLGRRGFEGLQRCIVDVPVAGHIVSSTENSLSEDDEKDRDLGEILKDDSSRGDEDITKMVSKVGRWWYAKCYESGVRGRSIWEEEGVVKECEKRETGLKLLICYAQKPESSKRRTASM